jgi:hypothetical protein
MTPRVFPAVAGPRKRLSGGDHRHIRRGDVARHGCAGPAVLLAGIGIEVAVGYRRLGAVRLRQVETDRSMKKFESRMGGLLANCSDNGEGDQRA